VNALKQEAEMQTLEGDPRFLRGLTGLALILGQGKKTRQRIQAGLRTGREFNVKVCLLVIFSSITPS